MDQIILTCAAIIDFPGVVIPAFFNAVYTGLYNRSTSATRADNPPHSYATAKEKKIIIKTNPNSAKGPDKGKIVNKLYCIY
jgi:hypothetical protein